MPLVRLKTNRAIALRRYGEWIVIRDMENYQHYCDEIHLSVEAFKELQKFKVKDIPE